jgi:hypothetical protein
MIIIISYMLQQQTQREKGNPKAEQKLWKRSMNNNQR